MKLSPELTRKIMELAGETTPAKLANVTYKFASEDEFQAEVIVLAHTLGWRAAHFRKVRVARKDGSVYWQTPVAADGKGFVDLVLCRERIVWIELKMPGGRIDPDQGAWHKALKDAGQELYVFYPADWKEIVAVLSQTK